MWMSDYKESHDDSYERKREIMLPIALMKCHPNARTYAIRTYCSKTQNHTHTFTDCVTYEFVQKRFTFLSKWWSCKRELWQNCYIQKDRAFECFKIIPFRFENSMQRPTAAQAHTKNGLWTNWYRYFAEGEVSKQEIKREWGIHIPYGDLFVK